MNLGVFFLQAFVSSIISSFSSDVAVWGLPELGILSIDLCLLKRSLLKVFEQILCYSSLLDAREYEK